MTTSVDLFRSIAASVCLTLGLARLAEKLDPTALATGADSAAENSLRTCEASAICHVPVRTVGLSVAPCQMPLRSVGYSVVTCHVPMRAIGYCATCSVPMRSVAMSSPCAMPVGAA